METKDLFAVKISKFRIDPNDYDKEELVQTLIKNYKKQTNRNHWDTVSNLHHYYNDWENADYEDLPVKKLINVYQNKITEFMDVFPTKNPVQWNWTLENITVNAQHMDAHDHTGFSAGGMQTVFSGVHYIKFNEKIHSPTTFFNPLAISQFDGLNSDFCEKLNNNNEDNSAYFQKWKLDTLEEDFIIFPSFLKHRVVSNFDDENYRITGVVNLRWKVF